MIVSLLLLFFGLTFIFFEFFVPGAVLGVFGGFLIFLSYFYFWVSTESILALIGYMFFVALCLYVMIKAILWKMANSKSERAFYPKGTQTGFLASSYDVTLIGKKGKAVTDLRPSGYVWIEGKKIPAISQMGYILKDSKIEVTGGSGDSLTVMLEEEENEY